MFGPDGEETGSWHRQIRYRRIDKSATRRPTNHPYCRLVLLPPPDPLITRRAFALAARRLDASRAIVVNGPRQSGKTALLGLLNADRGGTYVSLDNPADRASAIDDPTGFLETGEPPLFIDEIQRGGDALVLAIKLALDRSSAKGQFALAGSTRFLTEPRLAESLAGRVRFVDLWPLSQGEIDSEPDGFIDATFQDPARLRVPLRSAETRAEIFERVCRGGFPEAVLAPTVRDRGEFLADYARTITQRDIRELVDLDQVSRLRDLLGLLAARTGTELNVADLARVAGIPSASLTRYLPLFETTYVHHSVPAWSRNLTKKAIRRPKLHMIDTGLAAVLLGVASDALARPAATIAGQLLESFVAGELARQLTFSETSATLRHWRDRDGAEVDLILEASDGRIVGIEVKAAIDVNDNAFVGLRKLQRLLGRDFVAGVVLHCGDRPRSFGSGLVSLPIEALWRTPRP